MSGLVGGDPAGNLDGLYIDKVISIYAGWRCWSSGECGCGRGLLGGADALFGLSYVALDGWFKFV